jgi:hypothetical protein
VYRKRRHLDNTKPGPDRDWFPTKQIEGNIAKKRILIAEEASTPDRQLFVCTAGGGNRDARLQSRRFVSSWWDEGDARNE